MKVNKIALNNFRNYQEQIFTFNDGINVICGDNAQGKTNLLEAIYLLSTAKSFRTVSKKELIGFGKENCSVVAQVVSRNRDFEIKVVIPQNSFVLFGINGVKCKRNYEISDILNTVLFSSDDLDIIRGAALSRRKFIDNALSQLRPSYCDALQKYNKLMENKNKILKNGEEKPSLYEALEDFSEGMVKIGAYIIKRRWEFINFISREAGIVHNGFSNGKEKLQIQYKTVSSVSDFSEISKIEEMFRRHMIFHKQHEIASKQCLVGPHRDDFEVFINDINARSFGSQGQTRSAAISLKLAERQIFLKDTGEYPVLLLDDVLSELDKFRQEFILNSISEGQVFVTCCDENQITGVASNALFRIKNGRFL